MLICIFAVVMAGLVAARDTSLKMDLCRFRETHWGGALTKRRRRGRRRRPTGRPPKKSLRETINPLQNLEIAKFGNFLPQRYQWLIHARDFADEMISFRFGFVSLRAKAPRETKKFGIT
jgi:hypothetical protein